MVVFAVNRIADLFQDHAGVAASNWRKSIFHEQIEKFGRIGQIEIACKRQISAGDDRSAHKWMAGIRGSSAECAVSQMSKQHFAKKRQLFLEVENRNRAQRFFAHAAHRCQRIIKESLDWIALTAARAFEKWFARWHIKAHACDASAILSAIVLLLHQEIKFAKSPCGVAVLLLKPSDWLSQADKCKSAFMCESITHGECRRLADENADVAMCKRREFKRSQARIGERTEWQWARMAD